MQKYGSSSSSRSYCILDFLTDTSVLRKLANHDNDEQLGNSLLCIGGFGKTQYHTHVTSNPHTVGKLYSYSNEFPKHELYSYSNEFPKHELYSYSNEFPKHELYSYSNEFPKHELYSYSNEFPKHELYSYSNEFPKHELYSYSNEFPKHFYIFILANFQTITIL